MGQISKFIGWFCLKGTLVQPKNVVGLSSCDTESWFPIQPTKNAKISSSRQEGQNFNFIGWFCLKDKFLEQKTDTTDSCLTVKGCAKVSAKSESWFPIQPTKKWQNFFKWVRRSKFQTSLVGFL